MNTSDRNKASHLILAYLNTIEKLDEFIIKVLEVQSYLAQVKGRFEWTRDILIHLGQKGHLKRLRKEVMLDLDNFIQESKFWEQEVDASRKDLEASKNKLTPMSAALAKPSAVESKSMVERVLLIKSVPDGFWRCDEIKDFKKNMKADWEENDALWDAYVKGIKAKIMDLENINSEILFEAGWRESNPEGN